MGLNMNTVQYLRQMILAEKMDVTMVLKKEPSFKHRAYVTLGEANARFPASCTASREI